AITGIALIVGLTCAVAYGNDPPPGMRRLFMRVGLRHAVDGLAFASIAAIVLYHGAWRRGLGMRVVFLSFGVYGLEQLLVFGLFLWQALWGREVEWSGYLGIVDVVSLPFLGLGLLIWLLDDEHERAKTTSEQLAHMTRFDALTGLSNQRQI